MAYKALTYINLPPDNRKAPGDSITKKELEEARQTDEDIEALMKNGAMGESDDEIHSAHAPVQIITKTTSSVNVITGEVGGSDEENV